MTADPGQMGGADFLSTVRNLPDWMFILKCLVKMAIIDTIFDSIRDSEYDMHASKNQNEVVQDIRS